MTDQYKAAEVHEIGMATDMVLGEKALPMFDTIINDPITWLRPEELAAFDE